MITSPDSIQVTDTKEIEAARTRLLSLNTDIAVAQKALFALKKEIERATESKTFLEGIEKQLTTEVDELKEDKHTLSEEVASLTKEANDLIATNRDKKSEFDSKIDEATKLTSEANRVALIAEKREKEASDMAKKVAEDKEKVSAFITQLKAVLETKPW